MSESSNEERKEQIRFHQQNLGRLVQSMPNGSSLSRNVNGGWTFKSTAGNFGAYENPVDSLIAGLPVKLVSTEELNRLSHKLQSALDVAKQRSSGTSESLVQFATIQEYLQFAIEKVDNL